MAKLLRLYGKKKDDRAIIEEGSQHHLKLKNLGWTDKEPEGVEKSVQAAAVKKRREMIPVLRRQSLHKDAAIAAEASRQLAALERE